MELHQVDCFRINMRFWKYLGIWPGQDTSRYYNYYSKIFIAIFVVIYDLLYTLNFYFLPRQLDVFIEEMIFYFTELAVSSKVFTFVFMHKEIIELLNMLESEMFQPDSDEGVTIIKKAKNFNIVYWKIVATISILSNLTHILSPFIAHVLKSVELILPVCSYSFLSDEFKDTFIYPLYFYESIGMHFHMLYNLNVDTFFLGLMIYVIAQLEILDGKLRRVTDVRVSKTEREDGGPSALREEDLNHEAVRNINGCIIHFGAVSKFCSLIEDVFSFTIFVQFGMASCIICVCLFRFTLPAPIQYYIFLATYMFVMILQIMVPCWFGTRIMDKSNLLSFATYNCDWTSRSRQFKSNLRLFVERANKPLSITGGKMFCLSLNTFTSIMNSAYSFFTLLQHMQSRE